MDNDNHEAVARTLAAIAKKVANRERQSLEEAKKRNSDLKRPDFVWHYLLQSFATMGRASGWKGLLGNPDNYKAVGYKTLAQLAPSARAVHVEVLCRRAGIRMPALKAKYILGCFQRVEEMGGPEAARARLLDLPGREAKMQFLDDFPGIGPKYSRNIMMDVYHEDFRESIAIDSRIMGIEKFHGLEFTRYEDHESFWLGVAHRAGLNGWELDRVMFGFQKEFLTARA